MNQSKLFTCRRSKSARRWAITVMIAMMMPGVGGQFFVPTVSAQTAPTGQGFVLDAGDLRFIYEQILVAQDHAAGGTLLGPGPNQVHDPQLPRGLRTVDGSFNNLVAGQLDRNGVRSEGHTSELQSRRELVCRPLPETNNASD